MKQYIYKLDEVAYVATDVYAAFARHNVCALIGCLGAGKTTFVQELLRCGGVTEVVQSPTFAYVHSYTGYGERRWHHFDLYRLNHAEQFEAMGFWEYLSDPNVYVLIEWPEVILERLREYRPLVCDLRYRTDESRELLMYTL